MQQDEVKTPADDILNAMYPPEAPTAEDPPAEETPPEEPVEAAGDEETPQPQSEEIEPPAAADEPVEDDGDVVSSFSQLADHLETDQEFLEGLTVRQKINGEEKDYALSEVLATHRKVTAADEYLEDAKVKRSEILKEANIQKDQIGETATAFGVILKDLKDMYAAQNESIDWNQLRADDPAEYTAKKQDMAEMHSKIAEMEQRGRQAYNDYQTKARQQTQQQQNASLPEQQDILLRKLPDWTDPEKAGKEREEVAAYLYKEGLTEEQVAAAAYNGVILSMAVKSMRYDRAQGKKGEAAKKRVLKIPKVTKPGVKSESEATPKPNPDDRVSVMYPNG